MKITRISQTQYHKETIAVISLTGPGEVTMGHH